MARIEPGSACPRPPCSGAAGGDGPGVPPEATVVEDGAGWAPLPEKYRSARPLGGGGVLLAQLAGGAAGGPPPAPAASAPPPSLPPELQAHLEAKKLPADELASFAAVLRDYGFTPTTIADIDVLMGGDNLWMLGQPSTKALFEFCRGNFGYAFGADFPDAVRRIVDWEGFKGDVQMLSASYEMAALGGGMLGQEGRDFEGEFSKAIAGAFAKRAQRFLARWTPTDIAVVSGALARSGAPFMVEGVRYYGEGLAASGPAFRTAAAAARIDLDRLGRIDGGAYRQDAFLLTLAAGAHPDVLDRLERVVGELHPLAGRLTGEAVDFIGAYAGDARLAGVVGWIGANFRIGFTLDQVARLRGALAPNVGGEDAVGTLARDPASGERVKAFLAAHGLAFDPFRLKYSLWPPKAVAAYQRYKDEYKIQPLNHNNLQLYWNFFCGRENVAEGDPFLRPDVVNVTRALLEHPIIGGDEGGAGGTGAKGERELKGVVDAAAVVLAYERASPKSAEILGRLIDAGVSIGQAELEYRRPEVLAMLKGLGAQPALLDDVEALLRVMPSLKGWMGIEDVIDFIALPEKNRRDLTHPPMGQFIELLCTRYDLKPAYPYVKLIALQEKGAPLRQQIPWLQEPEAMAFYEANRDLFAERGKEGGKHNVDVVVAILALFLRSESDPKILTEARRWREVLGRPADAVFVRAYDDGGTRFLHDPGLSSLADAAAALGFREELMGESFLIERFLPHRKVLASPAFRAFYRELPQAYGFEPGSVYVLDDALDLYRDAGMRKFVARPEVRAFAAALKAFGFQGGWDRFERLRALFEHEGTLSDLRQFEEVHGVGLAKAIDKIRGLQHSPMLMMMRGIDGGFDTKGFDFFGEYLAMDASGDFDLLIGPGAKAASQRLKEAVGYELRLLDLSTFVTFLKTPRVRDFILSDAFAEFWKQLRERFCGLKFWLSEADLLMDLGQNAPATFAVLDGLRGVFPLNLNSHDELSSVAELMRNRPAFEALVGPKCKAVVESLAREHGYTFRLADMWGIISLADHEGAIERLYREDIEAFARRVRGLDPGNDIAERLEVARFLDDPANGERKGWVDSEAFLEIRERLARYDEGLSRQVGVAELAGLHEASRTPEVFGFLDRIGYRRQIFGGQPLLPHLPGLAALARRPGASALVKRLEAMSSSKCRYSFRPADGPALAALLEGRSAEEVGRLAAPAFRRANGRINANDILYAVSRRAAFVSRRPKLEAEVAAGFSGDVHRMDSNFDSYNSYNTPSAFSLVDLGKMVELKGWLAGPEARRSIGAIIERDIAQYPASELGGTILIGQTPAIFEGEPQVDFQNGSYRMPQEVFDRLSLSIAMYHLHATSRDDGLKAGPSGERFIKGGDVSFAEQHGIDGLVITSLDEKRFCVHFYDTDRNVAFLGTYEIPEGQ